MEMQVEWNGNASGMEWNESGMEMQCSHAAKASDAQALASLDRSEWPVASGQ